MSALSVIKIHVLLKDWARLTKRKLTGCKRLMAESAIVSISANILYKIDGGESGLKMF